MCKTPSPYHSTKASWHSYLRLRSQRGSVPQVRTWHFAVHFPPETRLPPIQRPYNPSHALITPFKSLNKNTKQSSNEGIEGTLFATLMSIFNGAGALGSEAGALLTSQLGVTENNFENLGLLVAVSRLQQSAVHCLFVVTREGGRPGARADWRRRRRRRKAVVVVGSRLLGCSRSRRRSSYH